MTPRTLDPRFRAILAFADGASSHIERDAARENAEAVARACGYTYDEALATVRGQAPAEQDEPDDLSHPTTTRDATIAAALAADPSRSDRDIARACRCSPTLVGRRRAEAGLVRQVRIVRRGGRSYEMRLGGAGQDVRVE